jgi:hypothetical protein
MTRIYLSDYGSDKNDGLTKQTAIYSWKKARRLFAGHMEISVDNAMTRKRLMKEIQTRLLRNSPASRFRLPPLV